ncbi:MAG TPA: YihY/virulence factor BrkB family protein [Aurantimonas sp.]|jgi:membrane protein|nr:YihY/virulence factor BrkB family protein [Aurantimonas sp.]
MNQSSRGRDAAKPSEIPARGWKEILWRVYGEISEDRVMLIAAGVTYYLLLAMVPGLSALISIYGLFFDPASIQDHTQMLSGIVPGGGMEILEEQMERLASGGRTTLGLTFAISLAIALWSANAGMKSLFEAMNVAYEENETRGFAKLTATSLAFTLSGIVGIICMIGVVVVVPGVLNLIGLGSATEWLIRIGSYVLLFVIASLAIAALFRWGPDRANAKWQWITPGTILSVFVILAVSALFSWYVANFGSYNETYGSLGALIGFLTWIWLAVTILIVGGELNSEMELQTARDTTTPPESAMGSRGATVADTVAGTPEAGDMAASPDTSARRGTRPRLSAGNLAFAVPAALLLAFLERRSRQR